LYIVFGFTVCELGDFLVFSQTLGMLSAIGNATKFAQAERSESDGLHKKLEIKVLGKWIPTLQ
jgi:hypothetical protein